jgi:hypothetical protein
MVIYNFNFKCVWLNNTTYLPGDLIPNPAESEYSYAQDALENTNRVQEFMNYFLWNKERYPYRGIDGEGREFVVTINCVDWCQKRPRICGRF